MKIVYSLILITFLSCSSKSYENISVAEFKNLSSESWIEIRDHWQKVNQGDSLSQNPQNHLADLYFKIFLENNHSEIKKLAIDNAFLMWSNVGDINKIKSAINLMDKKANYWKSLLNSLRTVYLQNDQRTNLISLLLQINKVNKSRKIQSSINYQLGDIYYRDDSLKMALEYFKNVIEIGIDTNDITNSNRFMYEIENLSIGDFAPNINTFDLNNKPYSLKSNNQKYQLIDFWATWCGPCLPEKKYLKEIHEKFGDKMNIISISLDVSKEELVEYLNKNDLPWTQIYDPGKWDSEIAIKYNISSLPKNFIIDPNGKIIGKRLRKKDLVDKVSQIFNK